MFECPPKLYQRMSKTLACLAVERFGRISRDDEYTALPDAPDAIGRGVVARDAEVKNVAPAAEDVLGELYAVMLSGLDQSGSSPPHHVGIHPPPQEGLQQPVEVLLQLRVREQNTCCTYLVEVQDRQISILMKSNSVGLNHIKYVPILLWATVVQLERLLDATKTMQIMTNRLTVCGLKKLQGSTEDEEVTRELRKLLKSDPVQRRPESGADDLDRDQEGGRRCRLLLPCGRPEPRSAFQRGVTNIKQELEDVVYELGVNLDTVKDTQACMKAISFLRRPLRECPPPAVDKHVQVVAAVHALQA
ncbi:hypothetical protein KRP22_008605 [Phytophthora ramorum]|nr:hypothetical protein KRP22_7437 [Phytophthora ramorum]